MLVAHTLPVFDDAFVKGVQSDEFGVFQRRFFLRQDIAVHPERPAAHYGPHLVDTLTDGQFFGKRFFQELAGDDLAVDFIGAFEDAVHAVIAGNGRHGVFFGETVSA